MQILLEYKNNKFYFGHEVYPCPILYINLGDTHMIKFCNLFSGSSGNSTYVESTNSKILIDAGMSCQKISKALDSIRGFYC